MLATPAVATTERTLGWWEAANYSVGVGYHRAWATNVSYGRVL